MRFRLLQVVAVVCVSGAVAPALAQSPSAAATAEQTDRAQILDRVSKIAYLRETAHALRVMLQQPQSAPNCDCITDDAAKAQLQSAWQAATVKGIDEAAFERDVLASLSAQLTSAEIKTWLAFYDTALGQRLNAAEKPKTQTRTEAVEFAELTATAKVLEANPVRRKVIDALVQAMRVTDTATDMMVSMSAGVAVGAAAVMPDSAQRVDTNALIQLVEQKRPEMRAMMTGVVPLLLAGMYKDFSLADLKRYAAHVTQPVMRKFTDAAVAAVGAGIKRQALAVGAAFGTEMQPTKL